MSRYIPKDKREQIKEEAGGQCRHCGSEERLTIDHIIAYSKCGKSPDYVLQCLCSGCNREKSNDEPEMMDMLQPSDLFGEPSMRINLADRVQFGGLDNEDGFSGLPKFDLW